MRSRWLRDLWWLILDHTWSFRHFLARLGRERLEFLWPAIARRLPRRLRYWVVLTAIGDAHLHPVALPVHQMSVQELLDHVRNQEQ